MPVSSAHYDNDVHAWSNQQPTLLRPHYVAQADIENIAEEIGSIVRTEKRELVSRLTILLLHLLKWQFQPKICGGNWQLSLDERCCQAALHFAGNPSLQARLEEAMAKARHVAMLRAVPETRLSQAHFHATRLYSFEQMMDQAVWPE